MLILISILNFVLCGVAISLMYQGVFIPSATMLIVTAVVTSSIYAIVSYSTGVSSKKTKKLMTMTTTFYISMILASLIYKMWIFEQIISKAVILKMFLVLFLLIALYGNLLYMRAEVAYKKKRGNQRIKEPKKDTIFQRMSKRNSEDDGVYIVLGESADNDK